MPRPLISSEKLVKVSLALSQSELNRLKKHIPGCNTSKLVRDCIQTALDLLDMAEHSCKPAAASGCKE